MSLGEAYETVANALEDRIFQLIPEHPEIMEIESAWDLFKIEGFNCNDLGPSAAQAGWALAHAKRRYQALKREGEIK